MLGVVSSGYSKLLGGGSGFLKYPISTLQINGFILDGLTELFGLVI
jgi:hypothetical protein